jgi:putative ABC transport system permease protein
MIKKNFKIAIRNAIKYKGTTFINIFGLSCGMAICIIIMAFISDQLSYDKQHKKSDRIYRVVTDYKTSGASKQMSTSPWPSGPMFASSIPQVESYTRVYRLTRGDEMVVDVDGVKFEDEKLMLVDSTFFDLMTYDFIYGDSKNALLGANNVVITNTVSEKLFGKVNPVGEFIKFDAYGFGKIYQISAVVNDKDIKTHLKFNYLIPIASAPKSTTDWMETWLKNYTYTYLCLKQKKDTSGMVMNMQAVFREQAGESADRWGTTVDFTLQNISDIHLTSHLEYEFEANGDIRYIYYFSFAGLFLLIIAIINFINLITIQSFSRAKEIGITKCIGGNKIQLIWQFLFESVFISFSSLLAAIILVILILTYFNSLLGTSFSFDDFNKPSILLGMALVWLFSGIGAGLYPAFVLSSYKPIATLKGEINRGLNKNRFIKGLVIFQFAITSILIFATFMVQKQVHFLQKNKMNFNAEQTLIVKSKIGHNTGTVATMKEEMLKNPAISMASFSFTHPGRDANRDCAFLLDGKNEKESIIFRYQLVDFDYFDFYGLNIIEGRKFESNLSSDSTDAYILNETAIKQLNSSNNLLGHRLKDATRGDKGGIIIGIVKDFNQESLKNSIVPLVFKIYPSMGYYLSLRINSNNISKEIDWIKKTMKIFEPDREVEYFFMDDYFNQIYNIEEKLGKIYLIFSIITILIAALGLFSLVSFITFKRKKEIGIRKVLGATNKSIYLLLSKDFIKWIIIANVIAFPIGYYIIYSWLNNYAFKTEIDVYIFLYTMLIGVFIAIITLSYRVVKVSRSKPVDSLKTE